MNNEKTGALIAELRKEKGLTQDQLGEQVFVSGKAVSKWERGLSFPSVDVLEKLAEVLGVTVTELLAGERIEKEHLEKNPFAETFWKRRDYFSKCSCPWLYGTDTVKGKRLEYVDGVQKIRDREIRGTALIKYKVYFTNGGDLSA